MSEQKKIITAKELAEKIGLNVGTIMTHLSIFPKYIIQGKKYYEYEYSYDFLKTIKEFYEKKMHTHNSMYAVKYYHATCQLEKMMKEIEG